MYHKVFTTIMTVATLIVTDFIMYMRTTFLRVEADIKYFKHNDITSFNSSDLELKKIDSLSESLKLTFDSFVSKKR